jgi:hypothetical protein
MAGPHSLDTALPDLGREHRPEALLTETHHLVADLDAALVEQILNVPQRDWEADYIITARRMDLGARLEVLEGVGFGQLEKLLSPLPRRNPSSFDKTLKGLALVMVGRYPAPALPQAKFF